MQPWVRRLRRCAVIKKAERAYWSIASTLPVNAAGTGIMSQMSPLLIDRGMSPATAAWLLSVFATSVLFSRLGGGWLIDHFSPRIVAAFVTSAPAAGCALLLLGDQSITTATLALLLIGIQQGAEIDLVGYLLARMFGLRNYASAYGVCVTSLGLSGSVGVAWFGRSFDANGDYNTALAIAIPCFLIGAACLLALGRRIVAHEPATSSA